MRLLVAFMPLNYVGPGWETTLPGSKLCFALLLLAALAPKTVSGQTSVFNQFNPISSAAQGVHLNGVSVFSGYYSEGLPYGNAAATTVSPGASPSYDVAIGAVATLGWNRSGERSSVSATYSPSYFGSIRHSEYNALNHSLSLHWTRKLAQKWSGGISVAGTTANLEQLLFTPTTLNSVASIPTTFDDLTSALLAGKYTNSQLAAILTGTPSTVSPDQTFLYGQRIFSASFNASLSYSPTGRSSFQFSLWGTRTQQLRNPGASDISGNSGYNLAPQMTSAGTTVGWSYSLTPRTQIGLTATSSRIFSRLQQGSATSANFSVGRTMSRHWFLQANGGAGTLNYSRLIFFDPGNVQYMAGGSIGFKTYAHTFMASYERSIGDIYGLGSGSTSSATGAWTWRAPGTSWSVFSSFVYQRLSNLSFQNPASWQANAGIGKTLSLRTFITVQYGYLKFPYLTHFTSKGINFSQSAVMVAFSWSPSDYR